MHGSGGSRGWLIHLMAGAALGAVVVVIVWIFSGGRPFGEVVGTSDVSSPTTPSAQRTDVQKRTAAPAGAEAQLRSRPPRLGAGKAGKGSGDALAFRKEKVSRPAKAKAKARAERAAAERRARARRRAAVRVVAPPSEQTPGADALPVAAVPSPAPSSTPAPAAAPAPPAKPAKPRAPTYVAGAGEG